jgi:hypothetical protein
MEAVLRAGTDTGVGPAADIRREMRVNSSAETLIQEARTSLHLCEETI